LAERTGPGHHLAEVVVWDVEGGDDVESKIVDAPE
jgi:hypothetical protein